MSQSLTGDFYTGTDLGKKQDHSVVAVVRRDKEGIFRLVHLKQFKLGSAYASVIGYLKVLNDRLQRVHKNLVDQTGVGEAVVEEAQRSVPNLEGIMLSAPAKTDVLTHLKMMMTPEIPEGSPRFLCPTTPNSSPN